MSTPTPSPPPPRITLVTRAGCHLCEEARQIVDRVATELEVGFEELDFDDHPELPAKYTELVPVLLVDGREIDHWRVDEQRLRRALGPEGAGHGTRRWLRKLRGR